MIAVQTGKVFGRDYRYFCTPAINDQLIEWVHEYYGMPAEWTNTANARWYYHNFHFWFRDDEDVSMFLLKWETYE